MKTGCILLSRLIFESAIWRDNPHVLKLFIYLIGQARYKDEPKKYPGFEVNRGELITSLSQIADDNEYFDRTIKKWSRAKVSRMLDVLEKQKYIVKLADTYGTHLSVCNYSYYQDIKLYKADGNETQEKRKRNASENNSEKDNKGNKDKKVLKPYVPEFENLELAKKLGRLILKNNPNEKSLQNGKFEKTLNAWANEFRLMKSQDKRKEDEINKVIEFSQSEFFYIPNIRSAGKLRKRFDEIFLRSKMKEKSEGGKFRGTTF